MLLPNCTNRLQRLAPLVTEKRASNCQRSCNCRNAQLPIAMPQPGKRARHARNVESEWDYSFALASVQLLVSAYEEVKAVPRSSAGQLLLERNDMLDQLSRPLGTAGFSEPVLHTGLKNLRNSCWLNSVLQCFYFCGPLQHAFTEDSMVGSMVNDVLVQLGNKKWDYVAPFRLLAQLYATYMPTS